MKKTATILLVYGSLIILGGLRAYLVKGSVISIIMASTFGALILLGSALSYKKRIFGAYFGLILTLLLDAVFSYRFISSMKFMPAGMLMVLSTLTLLLLTKTTREEKSELKSF